MNAPMPRKVKMLNLELYGGTTDLEEHLGVYKVQMYVQDVDNAAYYRCFPTTLKGMAQKGFSILPTRSITYFQELLNRFASQFIASCKKRRNSIHLPKVKQGLNVLLAKFVRRFHQEAILIPDLEDEVAYMFFLNGLKNGQFKFSLA